VRCTCYLHTQSGALGAVSRVTEGVDASTRYYEEERVGRRREPRQLAAGQSLRLLTTDVLAVTVPVPRSAAAKQAQAAAAASGSGGISSNGKHKQPQV
jgi:hypothetical protein